MSGIIKPLLVLTEPGTDECLMSLIARASHENAFEHTAEILVNLGLHRSKQGYIPFSRTGFAPEIAHLLSLPVPEIMRRMHPPMPTTRSLTTVDWYGTPLRRTLINAMERRISPRTLRAKKFAPAIWMIRPLAVCPMSFEYLLDTCPHCNSNLGWCYTKGSTVCDRCGRSLIRLNTQKKLAWDLRNDYARAASLVSTNPSVRADIIASLPDPFQKWEGGELFDAVLDLGEFRRFDDESTGYNRPSDIKASRQEKYSVENIVYGFRFMISFSESLDHFIKRVSGGRKFGEPKELYGPILDYIESTSSNRRLAALLSDELNNFSEVNDLRPTVPISGKLPGGLKPRLGHVVSPFRASQLFNVDRKALLSLCQNGKCYISSNSDKKGTYLFDMEMLSRSIKLYKDIITTQKCSNLLGAPIYTVQYLIKSGFIGTETDHDAVLLSRTECPITATSVNHFIARMTAKCDQSSCEGISVAEAMKRQFDPILWMEIISKILSSEIRAYGHLPGPKSLLSRILVDRNQINNIIDSHKTHLLPPFAISCTEAARLFGLNAGTIWHIIDIKLLPAVFQDSEYRILISDIQFFVENYSFTADGANRVGLSARQFVKQMRASGFSEAGKSTTKTNRFVWNRKDVDRFCDNFGVTTLTPAS